MPRRLRPAPFFIGLITGFAALSLLGAILVPRDLIKHFVRIHNEIATDFYFYPTAREFEAIVDEPVQPKPRVTVIIGGTSVLQGTSQYSEGIWSEHLKEILGPEYRVINLALRAGRANDGGNVAAEMLLKQHQPVIYVCDSMIAQIAVVMESSFYTKIVFDAWQRGKLLPWPVRDDQMYRAFWSSSPDLRETAWGSLLDAAANARDFWNWVFFEIGGTVWNSRRNDWSFVPLRHFVDDEFPPDWYKKTGYVQGDGLASEMRLIRSQILPDTAGWWKNFVDDAGQMPPALRAVSLVIVDLNSPHFLDMLAPTEKVAFVRQAAHVETLLKGIGFARTMVPSMEFNEDDYSDRVHLSVAGGRKLAEAVAPQIVEFAHTLGYFQ